MMLESKSSNFICKNCEYKKHQCFVCGELGSSKMPPGSLEVCLSRKKRLIFHIRCFLFYSWWDIFLDFHYEFYVTEDKWKGPMMQHYSCRGAISVQLSAGAFMPCYFVTPFCLGHFFCDCWLVEASILLLTGTQCILTSSLRATAWWICWWFACRWLAGLCCLSPGNSVSVHARRLAEAVTTIMTCCSWKGTSEQHQWTTHCRIATWQVQ